MASGAESLVNIQLEPEKVPRKVSVELPLSKSESNRLILLLDQGGKDLSGMEFSDSSDTKTLLEFINTKDPEVELGDGGTTYRFLTAYFAASGREIILNCSQRMKERPIEPLVSALKELGADIGYLENEGYPPLSIRKSPALKNPGVIRLDQKISSQFASALCLIAPLIDGGIDLEFQGSRVSAPYLDMTLEILKKFGTQVSLDDSRVSIRGTLTTPGSFSNNRDWSAASFFICLASLLKIEELEFPGLSKNDLQGDQILFDWAGYFGMEASENDTGIVFKRIGQAKFPSEIDLKDFPDLGLPLITFCRIKKLKTNFSGLDHLRFKESDRLEALEEELQRVYEKPDPTFSSHHDHRISMSLAMLAAQFPIQMQNPETVNKSFPGFWEELKKLGFMIS